jgi:hypothetical protein
LDVNDRYLGCQAVPFAPSPPSYAPIAREYYTKWWVPQLLLAG